MILIQKVQNIINEYVLRKESRGIGSGAGGNMLYFCYLYGRENIISQQVQDIEFIDNRVIWNPDFLSKSKLEIRTHLDSLIKDKIEIENYN